MGARVIDLVGLCCYAYTDRGMTPPLL